MKSDSDGSPADDADGVDGEDTARTAGTGDSPREERQPAVVGARASAGSARAAARASAAGKAVTPGKGRPTRTRDGQGKRPNIFARIVRYLREVVAELSKVIWPTRNEMVTYSIVVVLFLVFMVALTWALDLAFAKSVLAIFG